MAAGAVEFASLLCSRLCHDLLSPVGALNNGLELLADERDPAMRERCMELLAESARASAAKLKFFRLAFGAAGGFGDVVDSREARSAIEDLLAANRRLAFGWLVEEDTLPKPAAKVLLNLGMIAGDALVRGGRLDIGAERGDTGALEIVLQARGARLVLDPVLRDALTGGGAAAEITARTAAAHLVHAVVTQAGGRVQIDMADGTLLIGAAFPAPVAAAA
ncbi:histidine phosphotransferase family protein [Sphingomonas bacterium]|uniref:histidine phosphotransferase family protein n=1 Tax=Sphingomonas bacterium TaxID=1895847 RepID=UPI0015771352|nr:histidine phosphotransferase family protein [Sphingomonas bacterium]